MRLWNTYYIASSESDFSGEKTSGLYTSSGALIAMAKHAFAQDLFVEGTGFLDDGRLLNVSGTCQYGDYFSVTPSIHGSQCYHVVDPRRAPWGVGVQSRPLVPLRTIAVDHRVIPYGTEMYIRQFDGLNIPRVMGPYGPFGGFRHNGRFIAGDTGGAIDGNHIDIFAGNRSMMRALEAVIPTRSQLDASIGGGSSDVVKKVLTVGAVGTGLWLIYEGFRRS